MNRLLKPKPTYKIAQNLGSFSSSFAGFWNILMDVESKRPNMGKTITAAIDPINKIGTSDLFT